MDPIRKNHENLVANQTSNQAGSMLTKGPRKPIRDDINKLFEAINIRTSKSLDLSDHSSTTGLTKKNASKRPMQVVPSYSHGIGFSEPVSLKQALRGLCISQAGEVAAKRLLKSPGSPRISIMHRSIVVETVQSSIPVTRESMFEISLVPEESLSSSLDNTHENLKKSNVRLGSQNDGVPVPIEVNLRSLEPPVTTQKTKQTLNNDSIVSVRSSPKRKVGTFTKANLKLRQKTKLPTVSSSIAVKINKEKKSIRSTPFAMKQKQKQEHVINESNLSEAIGSGDHNSNQLICDNCQCSLTDIKEPGGYLLNGLENTVRITSKVKEKGELSQSSKSSIGEFSISTSTSASDDSNGSRSSCGNRPHMSKDFKWEAINNVRKQHKILGLRHFNLLKKLGSGDIGTVYLAELVKTNCLFAIKVMDNEFLARRKKMPRARTEREILRMLDHPFLPTLYAQFTSGTLSCLVMEFCPGGDLHVLRQKQPGKCFPEQEARFYVAEVLLALEYLHMLGIVYRDLKPENILVREDGHIMLTDFDLSLRCSVNPTLLKSSSFLGIEPPRISGPCVGSNCIDPFCAGPSCKVSCFTPRIFPTASTRTRAEQDAAKARSLPQLVVEPKEARSNSFVGTHEYLAPEIIKGEGHGSSVDWWTLGIFLYELLFGKTPFRGPGNEETLANVALQNLRIPNTPIISFQARDLIRGLLVKEPENRFGTETGAAEIKRHPFFDGLNWALIRCAIPPQIPQLCDIEVSNVTLQEKGKSFMECSAIGDHLEFELF